MFARNAGWRSRTEVPFLLGSQWRALDNVLGVADLAVWISVTMSYGSVHLRLVEVVPEFAPILAEHLEDQEGELLQHVLFGDLTRFVVEAYERGNQALLTRCLNFLDEALREGDEMTQNLVAVSFVENVGPWDEAVQEFIAGWPSALREEARRQREWQPGEPGI